MIDVTEFVTVLLVGFLVGVAVAQLVMLLLISYTVEFIDDCCTHDCNQGRNCKCRDDWK